MQIQLTEDKRQAYIGAITEFYDNEFDEELSSYRAEQILDFFIKALGPGVYNQAIQDARQFIQDKLEDLDTDFYIPE